MDLVGIGEVDRFCVGTSPNFKSTDVRSMIADPTKTRCSQYTTTYYVVYLRA